MKKVLYVVLMLGWIPTLAVVTGSRWISGQSAAAQGNTPVKVTRLYTGPDGKTKVEELEIPLKPRDGGSDTSGGVIGGESLFEIEAAGVVLGPAGAEKARCGRVADGGSR